MSSHIIIEQGMGPQAGWFTDTSVSAEAAKGGKDKPDWTDY